jgi:hypothetical protein
VWHQKSLLFYLFQDLLLLLKHSHYSNSRSWTAASGIVVTRATFDKRAYQQQQQH